MKNYLILIILLFSVKSISQNDTKEKFQKNKYDLGISYFKKSDFVKALDQFSIASKIKPDNEIAQQALKKVDTLKEILRKDILAKVNGTWLMTGDKPDWTLSAKEDFKNKKVDKLIEVVQDKLLFYDQDRKSKVKTLTKTENIIYFNNDKSDSLYSAIILSDGKIWDCFLDENSKTIRAVNIAEKGENGIEKITDTNKEVYYIKVI
ncbi:hypothetical protein ASE21_02325 [Flavobacterium sp. Root901]|uniref:hypothetical protein n=1 Tax=Flavobacterium sp. Root901 TaxID=1736605 RepID=UPI0007091555|nr:hypothetical protein [Flavobacterium sp. Root901]KRD12765.1 hypothetical protein ASE21_02325 [Flavobacterium sp. Root901]